MYDMFKSLRPHTAPKGIQNKNVKVKIDEEYIIFLTTVVGNKSTGRRNIIIFNIEICRFKFKQNRKQKLF